MILGVLQAPLLKLESRSVVDKLCLPVLFASKSRNQRALFCVESSASCEVIGFQCLDQSTSSLSTRAPMPWMEIFFSQFLQAFCPAYAILPPIKLNTANHEHLDQRVRHQCAAGSPAKSHGLNFSKKVH